ncbi:MAG TPA: two-component regulator propeller domain-containing protein [Blastocatellia bacterium]|nr:two-component regulator propeller domain-containing protein [Blastocatellia bacterium]
MIVFWLAVCLQAQALDPRKAVSQYRHQIWRTENGLPQNSIYAITQTPDGYLWLGTSGGLVRFDGVRFTTFDSSNTGAIKRNTISRLFADREGNLWIDTLSGGVVRYRNGQFMPVTVEEGLPRGVVTAWCEDREGRFWIASLPGGLMQWRGDRFVQMHAQVYSERIVRSPVLAMTFDRQGALWLGTREAGLWRLRDGQLTAFTMNDGLPDYKVNSLYSDRNDDLWICSDNGLAKWSRGKITREGIPPGLHRGRVLALQGDRDGNLWAGVSGEGLYRLSDGKVAAFTEKQGLTGNTVTWLFEASDGSLWAGTTAGLNRFGDGLFTTFTAAEGLPTNDVGSIFIDTDGGLWIAPTAGGLHRFKDGRYRTYRHGGLAGDRVYTIVESRAGGLWLGRQIGGLTYLDLNRPEKSRTYTEGDGLPQNNIFTICEDRDGGLWIGTVNGALCRLQDGKFTTYTDREGYSADIVNAIIQDRQGQIWIGSDQGLIRYSAGVFKTYTTKDGLAADDVKALLEDSEGAIWIGTGAGLTRFKQGRLASLRANDGLFDQNILGLIEDGQHRFWFSGMKGLFRASLPALNDAADDRRRNVTSIAYNTLDGLRGTEVVSGKPPSVRGPDGRLWFSTNQGVAMVDPLDLPRHATPPVHIESIVADGEHLAMNGAISIEPGVDSVEINYTGIDLLIPERVRFKFKLEGYDKGWTEVGNRRVASYPHLPPGNYRFRVTACSSDGVWNEKGAEVSFHVRPFFYQTYPFYGLCAALIAVGLRALYRLRLKQIRERFGLVLAERTRVAREIHDTLLQRFTGISLKLDAISQQLPDSSAAKPQIEKLLEQTDQALTEARQAVWNMRSPMVESHGFANAMVNSARQIVDGTPTQLQFVVEGSVRDLPPAVEDNLLRVCQEAVTNTIKHANAKQIRVVLKYERRQVQLRVDDDGCGFDWKTTAAAQNGHFGLVGMQERAKKDGGQLTLNSSPGAGTQVVVKIPVK